MNSDCVHLTSELTDVLISQKAAPFLSCFLSFSLSAVFIPPLLPRVALYHLSHPSSDSHSIALSLLLFLLTQPRCLSACGWRYYVGIDYSRPNTGWIYSSAAATPHSLSILIPLSEPSPFLPLHLSLPFSHSFLPLFSPCHSLSFSIYFPSISLYFPSFMILLPPCLLLTSSLPAFLFSHPTLLTPSLSSAPLATHNTFHLYLFPISLFILPLSFHLHPFLHNMAKNK